MHLPSLDVFFLLIFFVNSIILFCYSEKKNISPIHPLFAEVKCNQKYFKRSNLAIFRQKVHSWKNIPEFECLLKMTSEGG